MKHIYFILPLLAVALIVQSAHAQSRLTDANIYGHVLDAHTRDHLGFASVVLKDLGIGTQTDSTGHFFLSNLPEGRHTIEVSFMGYRTRSATINIEMGQTLEYNFHLVPETNLLDQLVVTGSRYSTKRRETGQLVNVVPPRLFEQTVAANPAGVLDFQPGLRVEYDCSNCGFSQLRINGLSGQYTQVLLDSRPVFSSLSMVYGLEQMPASMIERIEVVRGGGSALFGANAIGGTVNIITKEPVAPSLSFSNQSGVLGGQSFEHNTALNASLLSEDRRAGAYLFTMVRGRGAYDRNGDGFSELPRLRSETVGMRSYYKFSPAAKLTAEYHHIHEYRRGGDSLALPPQFCLIAEQAEHYIDGGSLSFDFASGYNSISVYGSAQHIGRSSYYGTNRNPDAFGRTKDLTINAGAQYVRHFERFLFMPSNLMAGFDYTFNRLDDRMTGYHRHLQQTTHIAGIFLQNEWSNAHFGLLAGLRLDKHNLLSLPILSPRLIVRYAPDAHWTLRAGYARGFRAPQAYDEDLHVAAVGGEVSIIDLDDNLLPEHSDAFTLSVDYWRQSGEWRFDAMLEGFFTNLRHVFVLENAGYDAQGNLHLLRTNASGAYVAGANAELRAAFNSSLELQAGATIQRSRYKEPFAWSPKVTPQQKMFRSPGWYGYATATWDFAKHFQASFNGTFTGPMLIEHYAGWILEDEEVMTPAFFDGSVRIAWHFHPTSFLKCELSLSCKNFLDSFQKDIDSGMLKDSGYMYGPAQPRTWLFGVKFNF